MLKNGTIKVKKLDGRGSEHRCSVDVYTKDDPNNPFGQITYMACARGHARSDSAPHGGRGRVECQIEAVGMQQ